MANEFKIKNGLVVSGSADFEQDLTVRGRLTADELHISIVSSSVLFESGSTQFGNSITDTHKVTGSLSITGSMSLNGQSVETNRLAVTTFNTYTASLDPRISDLETSTGSINSFTSSTNLRLTSLETSTGSINSYTASNTTNIDAIHISTSSLNTFTSSANGRLNSIEGVTGSISSLNTYTGSNNTIIGTLQTSTGSLNTFTSSATDRLNSVETSTGSLNSYTASNITNINAIHTSTGSLNTFTSSASGRLTAIETSTGSINSYTSSNTTNINSIHTTTSSLNSYTSSNTTAINALNTSTASLNSYTSSNTTNINAIHTSTGSLNSYTASNTTNINAIHTSTASLNTFTSSAGGRLTSIETSTGSLNSYTASNTTNINAIHTTTGSLNSYTASNTTNINAIHTTTSSLNSFTSSATSRLNSIEGVTGSIAALNTYTGSNDSTNTAQNNRLGSLETKTGSLEGKTGSYATTGSNVFQGSQTITGSLFISQNLIVGGSSSINFVSQSTLNIGTNLITVNAQNPGTRFGGLSVIDSGSSPTVSGSMLFDSVNDQWIFVHQNQSTITSSVLLMGPQTINSLGSESYPTTNKVLKSVNAEHVGDSNITDTGTKVSINSNTEITGSLIVAGGNKLTVNATGGDEGGEILLGKAVTNTTLSGEGVTIDVWQNRLRIFEQGGNARGAYLDISTLGNGASTNLLGTVATASYVEFSNVANKPTLVSGSSQITFLSISSIPVGLVSGSSQVLNGSGVWSGSAQLPAGTVSGSSQVLNGSGVWSGSAQLPSGVVSGSSQITYSSISSIPTGIVSGSAQVISLLPSGTVSGSSQVLAGTTIHSGAFFNGISVVSGSAQISFNGITDKPALVSGSSQITFGSLTGLPSGLVSGSSQITFLSISSIPSGLVSGSSQVAFSSLSGLPSGLVSGSSQISFGSISGVPSGLVSGSSQITLSSTSGFGSYLNQAVLTTSSPTFDSVITSNNGNGTNFRIGDDAWIGDVNLANTFRVQGVQNAANAYIIFGNADSTALGRASTGALTYGGNTVYHSGNLTNLNQLTNGPGYITGISFANVSSKPTTISGYGITDAITTGNIGSQSVSYATTAGSLTSMNISQFTNNSGYITGIAFSSVSSKPTTLSGYGITDSLYQDRATVDVNAFNTTGLYRGSTSGWSNRPTVVHNGGALLQIDTHPGNYHSQLFFDTGGNRLYMRSADAGSWGSWVTMYHSGNLTNLNQLTNGPGYITGISFANVSSKPTTLGGYGITDAWQAGGSWGADLTSNGFTRQIGLAYTGGEFAILTNNSQISTLIDGSYFAGESGGFYSLNNSNAYSSRVGFSRDGSGNAAFNASVVPTANNTYNLGSTTLGWANVYTNDLHLSNMNKPEGNDIDGTSGNWTIQEGAENLYIINNNNGKKFKISLEEII